jgi:hypothetical protein
MPQEKLVNIKLSDIRPNPNRDLKFNPFNEEKITALMASIGETGFWTNVIVRKAPDGKGYEQAYGHHRIEAARRSGIKEADFVVRDLDENMMLKMMELENQEDYRYCPLSLLESVKAVVNALAAGRIAPFEHTLNMNEYRTAPKFTPVKGGLAESKLESAMQYTVLDVARYLGRTKVKDTQSDPRVYAALDALYLLDVHTITTSQVKNMNWSQLGRFVADAKAERERTILRKVKTAEEIKALNEKALSIQAEQRAKEKRIADERSALVKKEAEAKREADAKKAKEIKERIAEKDEQAEAVAETFKAKRAAIDTKVEEVKQKQVEAKQEDLYLPIRRESVRIIHLLERRDEEEEIKALSRRDINANDRELLRQAAIAKGTWYLDFIAAQFLPPLSAKSRITKETK